MSALRRIAARPLAACRDRRPRRRPALRHARPAELPLRRGGDGRPGAPPEPLRHVRRGPPTASRRRRSTTWWPGSGRDRSAPARSGCARSRRWPGRPRSSSSTSAAVALPLPRRAGLIAAALVAVSPVLIWFSQDARAYALVFLLTALSFLFFARARRGGARRDLAWWAALLGPGPRHPLLRRLRRRCPRRRCCCRRRGSARRGRRRSATSPWRFGRGRGGACWRRSPCGRPHNAHAGWIAAQPLGERLERAGAKLVGERQRQRARRPPRRSPIPLAIPARSPSRRWRCCSGAATRRSAVARGSRRSVGAAAVALPLLLGPFGADYFDGRNLMPVFVPLIVLLGAGFGVRRAGWAGLALAAAFCLCSLVFTLRDRPPAAPAAREPAQRRGARSGRCAPATAVVTVRYAANQPLRYYLGAGSPPARCRRCAKSTWSARSAPPGAAPAACCPHAFHRVELEAGLLRLHPDPLPRPAPVRVPLRRARTGRAGRRRALRVRAVAAPLRLPDRPASSCLLRLRLRCASHSRLVLDTAAAR